MSDVKHETHAPAKPAEHAPKAAAKAPKTEKPQTLQQKLDDLYHRVEAASNSSILEGKAEEFADCWDELDGLGDGGDNPADAAMIQAAHNHLQHHAPQRASEIEALEAELERVKKSDAKPQAKPDSPEMAHVKSRIAALQTELATDPRALPGDKEKAQALQHKVDGITMEKSTAK